MSPQCAGLSVICHASIYSFNRPFLPVTPSTKTAIYLVSFQITRLFHFANQLRSTLTHTHTQTRGEIDRDHANTTRRFIPFPCVRMQSSRFYNAIKVGRLDRREKCQPTVGWLTGGLRWKMHACRNGRDIFSRRAARRKIDAYASTERARCVCQFPRDDVEFWTNQFAELSRGGGTVPSGLIFHFNVPYRGQR